MLQSLCASDAPNNKATLLGTHGPPDAPKARERPPRMRRTQPSACPSHVRFPQVPMTIRQALLCFCTRATRQPTNAEAHTGEIQASSPLKERGALKGAGLARRAPRAVPQEREQASEPRTQREELGTRVELVVDKREQRSPSLGTATAKTAHHSRPTLAPARRMEGPTGAQHTPQISTSHNIGDLHSRPPNTRKPSKPMARRIKHGSKVALINRKKGGAFSLRDCMDKLQKATGLRCHASSNLPV